MHSLLQAVQEIAARGEGRDRDVHIFVQRRCVMSDQIDIISQCFNEFYVVFKIYVLKNSLKNNHMHCAEELSLLPTLVGVLSDADIRKELVKLVAVHIPFARVTYYLLSLI